MSPVLIATESFIQKGIEGCFFNAGHFVKWNTINFNKTGVSVKASYGQSTAAYRASYRYPTRFYLFELPKTST